MINTKFCDVCNAELPPCCFPLYECFDTQPHELNPNKNFSSIRITASPGYTNGDSSSRVDACPDCFLKMVQGLAKKIERRNKREAGNIEKWCAFRATSKKNDVVREGANKQA